MIHCYPQLSPTEVILIRPSVTKGLSLSTLIVELKVDNWVFKGATTPRTLKNNQIRMVRMRVELVIHYYFCQNIIN